MLIHTAPEDLGMLIRPVRDVVLVAVFAESTNRSVGTKCGK